MRAQLQKGRFNIRKMEQKLKPVSMAEYQFLRNRSVICLTLSGYSCPICYGRPKWEIMRELPNHSYRRIGFSVGRILCFVGQEK